MEVQQYKKIKKQNEEATKNTFEANQMKLSSSPFIVQHLSQLMLIAGKT